MLTNRPEAFIVHAAPLHLGTTTLSVYNALSPEHIEYLLAHAAARVADTEAPLVERILEARSALPALERAVAVDGQPDGTRPYSELEETDDSSFASNPLCILRPRAAATARRG